MAQGLQTLPDNYVMGSLTSDSDFTYSLQQSLQETNPIYTVTGGHYRASTAQDDLIFVQDDGIHWRSFDAATGVFNGSVFISNPNDIEYIATADLNNDGFGDLVGINPTPGTLYDRFTGTIESPPTLTISAFLANPGVTNTIPFDSSEVNASTIPVNAAFGETVSMGDFAIADFNHDGNLDIIVSGIAVTPQSDADETIENSQGVYAIGLGNGEGAFTFQPLQKTASLFEFIPGDNVLPRVTAADFNNDGYVDVVFGYREENDLLTTAETNAYLVWGDATSSSNSPILNMDSSNIYFDGDNWNSPQDVLAVWGYAGANEYQLVIAGNSSTHIAWFNNDKTLFSDTEISGTPRGPLGTALDYNLDGQADIMFSDGNSSTILIDYPWPTPGESDEAVQYGNMTLGTDIKNAAGLDFNGDGRPDWFGSYSDNHLYAYVNQTVAGSSDVAIDLKEGIRVGPGAINGVAARAMTGTDFALSVVGGRAGYDNALGWFEVRADGTFGDAHFLDIGSGPNEIDGLAEGSRLALFLVANGAALNEDLTGSFRFVDAGTGDAARLGASTPMLVSVERDGESVMGNIFHTADANAFDMLNPLNAGGGMQSLSRIDADGSLQIAFEDELLTSGDADFNDLIVRVTPHDSLFWV
ncbi:hypothetical protein ABLE91_28325 [Aquabacter sp. CN5-332]|uniref:hypothetical protein n=1 Tax=Aquabacter sp. CN5-332 TaxID=3156608 RepID=UPI0032B5EBE8